MKISNTLKTVGAAVALTAGTLAVTQASAQASGDTPIFGELCTAKENIQFYNGSSPSYVVAAGGYIRIDSDRNGFWVQGHGEGHSTRDFQWLHSNYASRVTNCH